MVSTKRELAEKQRKAVGQEETRDRLGIGMDLWAKGNPSVYAFSHPGIPSWSCSLGVLLCFFGHISALPWAATYHCKIGTISTGSIWEPLLFVKFFTCIV